MTLNPHIAETRHLRLYENEVSPASIAADLGIDIAEVLDFSLNVNPFGPPPAALPAAQAALARGNQYPDLQLGTLRRRLSRQHRLPEHAYMFGAGLDDVLKLILQAWVSVGDRVLVHLPTFPRYELEAALRGAVVVAVKSEPFWQIDVQALRRCLRADRIALAFLCTPNNPTGAALSTAEIGALASEFRDTLFVVDEALIDPRAAGTLAIVPEHKNLAVLRTFSKYFGLAGFRVGYAVAERALIAAVEAVRPPFNVAAVSAAAAAAALDDVAFLDRTAATFHAEAAFFAEKAAAFGGCDIRGRYGNMILMELRDRSSEEFVAAMARRGILVADGKSFHGLEAHETVRISLRDRPANERLVAAMAEV